MTGLMARLFCDGGYRCALENFPEDRMARHITAYRVKRALYAVGVWLRAARNRFEKYDGSVKPSR